MDYRLRHKVTIITICKVTCKKRISKNTICICIWRSVNVDMLIQEQTNVELLKLYTKKTRCICIHFTLIICYEAFIRYLTRPKFQLFSYQIWPISYVMIQNFKIEKYKELTNHTEWSISYGPYDMLHSVWLVSSL